MRDSCKSFFMEKDLEYDFVDFYSSMEIYTFHMVLVSEDFSPRVPLYISCMTRMVALTEAISLS
jgi:hypothetical protein